VSVQYPLKGIHIISGEQDVDGRPKPGAVITLERTNGEFIQQVDPKTRQCNGKPQQFEVLLDGLRPIR
jgi:hypothetical protein